jgi:O-antigen ligase
MSSPRPLHFQPPGGPAGIAGRASRQGVQSGGGLVTGTGAGYAPEGPLVALVMICVIAIRVHEFVPGAHLLQPALLATFGGFGLLYINTQDRIRRVVVHDRISRLAIAYLLWAAATIPFALWPGLAFATLKGLLPAVALLLSIMLCSPDWRTFNKLQRGLVIAASIYALYTLIMGRVFADNRLMAGVGMYDSNDMAALLAISFPMAIGAYRHSRGTARNVMLGSAILLVAVIVASGSRGGALGLIAGALVLATGMKGSRRVAAYVVLVAAAAVTWHAAPDFRDRMVSLTNLEDDYNTVDEMGRKQVWARGREHYKDNPVMGVGAGNFPIAEGAYFDALYQGARGAKWSTAHNSYLQAFAELGTVGGVLFVLLVVNGLQRALPLWRGVRRGRAERVHRPELLASMCAFAVAGYFLSHAYFPLLFGALGMIGLASRAAAFDRLEPVQGGAPFANRASRHGHDRVSRRTSAS